MGSIVRDHFPAARREVEPHRLVVHGPRNEARRAVCEGSRESWRTGIAEPGFGTSLALSTVLFIAAFYVNVYAIQFATERASNSVTDVVLSNIPIFDVDAMLIEVSELLIGVVLLIGAADIGRRRFAGRLGAQHGYEAPLALGSALAGLAAAGLTLSIGILMGEGLPTVAIGRAFSSAIPIELFIVPLGVAIAWLELGRFLALRRSRLPAPAVRARLVQQPQGA